MGIKVHIISGLSGSGKTIALHTLEDLGYYCIDNLPISLLDAFAKQLIESPDAIFQHTAVGVDARNQPENISRLPDIVSSLRSQGILCEVIFLEAQSETLIKRFSETRRKHPLTNDYQSLVDAIQQERLLLEPILNSADLLIDTSHMNMHELRDLIHERVGSDKRQVSLLFKSFGFKNGVPRDADFVFDVRCLPNPYWNKELRAFTGRDQQVVQFLDEFNETRELRDDLIQFLERWIPRFRADGRTYLTFAIGCTGGQHRSVYMAEQLVNHFRNYNYKVLSRHRELP